MEEPSWTARSIVGPREREQHEREDEQVEQQRKPLAQPLKKRAPLILLEHALPEHERGNGDRPPPHFQQIKRDDDRHQPREAEGPWIEKRHRSSTPLRSTFSTRSSNGVSVEVCKCPIPRSTLKAAS